MTNLDLKAPPSSPVAWRFRATYLANGEEHFDYATFVSQTWFGARARAFMRFVEAVRVEHVPRPDVFAGATGAVHL